MFSLTKQVFIVLLSLTRDWTRCLFSNDEPCMVRPTSVDMNPFNFEYYLFMISSNKCTGSCNVLSLKLWVPKGTKDTNFKVFITIANKQRWSINKMLHWC